MIMKIYAVIDTNVIVSALLSHYDDAATVQTIKRVISGDVVPIYNDDIINEYLTVLHRSKFNFSESLITETIKVIIDFGISTERLESSIVLPDPKDLVFYEVALSVDDSFLVTGNIKHFPKKPFIVTPAELLRIMNELSSGDKRLLNEPPVPYGKL